MESRLLPGEAVLYATRPHWVVLVRPGVTALALALAGWAIPDLFGVGPFLMLAALLVAGIAVAHRELTEVAVTNRRIMMNTGLLSRRSADLLLSKVESVTVNESLLGRILGYGAVVVHGTGGTPEPFSQIARPLEFGRHVQQQIVNRRGASDL